MSKLKNYLMKVKSLPAKIKNWLKPQNGKTVLRLGRDSMTSKPGEPLQIMKMRSNFMARLKNLVLLPWRYLFYGKIEL